MARLPRLVIPGELHLLMQRSHPGQPVFRDDEDFAGYRQALVPAASEHGVAIHAYALVPTHVLLLATPSAGEGLSRMLQAIGRRFGAEYNRRHRRSGVLWEGRFRTTVVDARAHLLDCTRHVEWAPVRAGLCSAPQEWAWSSAAHHLGLRADPSVTEHPRFWTLGNTPFEREATYRALLDQPLSSTLSERFDQAVAKGWAIGEAGFLRTLAERSTRRVAPLPRGRPRKMAEKTVPK